MHDQLTNNYYVQNGQVRTLARLMERKTKLIQRDYNPWCSECWISVLNQ